MDPDKIRPKKERGLRNLVPEEAPPNCANRKGLKRSNVIERIRPELSLIGKVTKQKLSYFGHVMRANSMENEMMLGMVDGDRRRGRPRTRWLDSIKTDTRMDIIEPKETVIDGKAWKCPTHRVTSDTTV